MLLITSLLGCLATGQAIRVVPEVSAMAWQGTGAFQPVLPGRPAFFPEAAKDQEVPDPFGVRKAKKDAAFNYLAYNGGDRVFIDPEPLDPSGIISQRVADRGGAPVQTWRVEQDSSPKVLKVINIFSDKDLFAAKNEFEAVLGTLEQDVFVSVEEMWTNGPYGHNMELVMMTEDYAGTLLDVMVQHYRQLDAVTALNIIADVTDQLRILQRKRIAHDSPTINEVLIVGDPNDFSSWRAVLCSSLTNTHVRIWTWRDRLRQLLGLKARHSVNVRMRSLSQVQIADEESLDRITGAVLDLISDKELDELYSISLEVARPGTYVKRVECLRTEWLLRHPGPLKAAKRSKGAWRRNLLGMLWTPNTKSKDFANVMNDITETIQRNVQERDRVKQFIELEHPEEISGAVEEVRQMVSHWQPQEIGQWKVDKGEPRRIAEPSWEPSSSLEDDGNIATKTRTGPVRRP